jgi:hypothetical protein
VAAGWLRLNAWLAAAFIAVGKFCSLRRNSTTSRRELPSVDDGTWRANQLLHLMDLFRHSSFRVLCALFAFFVFTGDIVADAVYEASGACATECETSGCDTCPACVCPTHSGSAVASESDAVFGHDLTSNDSVPTTDDQPAFSAPPAIDHPPQLV